MREDALRAAAICKLCDKPIGAGGLPLFWRMTLERHGVKSDALNRQQGLTMMLGGEAALARVLGPDEELTTVFLTTTVTVCELCMGKHPVPLRGRPRGCRTSSTC